MSGFLDSRNRNRRLTWRLFAVYQLAFQLIGALALTIFLLCFDEANTILTNPVGYATRYSLWVGLFAAFIFALIYRGHARHVMRKFHVREVSREDEPRFVDIAEKQCTLQGIRLPRFGIIETQAINAITVGEGPKAGLIAVTRGLIEALDDDELATVVAHEAAHIRNGDTSVLAANHAMLRTAITLQINNALRMEDWRQSLIILALPFMLPVYLVSGSVSYAALQLSRLVRREIDLARDNLADAEAVRATHHPDALASAIRRISGKGAFPRWHEASGLLFEEPGDDSSVAAEHALQRIENIELLAGSMMNGERRRRDTRDLSRHDVTAARASLAQKISDAPDTPPVMPGLMTMFTDWGYFWSVHSEQIDWYQWHANDRRNILGIKLLHLIPFFAVAAFLLIYHFPKDGDFNRYARVFDPTSLVVMAQATNHAPVCHQVSGSDVPACFDRYGRRMPEEFEHTKIMDSRQMPITIFVLLLYIVAILTPDIRHWILPGYSKGEISIADNFTKLLSPSWGRYGGGTFFGDTRELPRTPPMSERRLSSFDLAVEQKLEMLRRENGFDASPPPTADPSAPNADVNLRPLVRGFGRKAV